MNMLRRMSLVGLVLAFGLIAAACGGSESTDTTEGTVPPLETTAAPAETTAAPAAETTAAPEETTTTAAPGETTTTAAAADTTTTTSAAPGKAYGGEAINGADQEPPTLNPYVPGGDNTIVSLIGQAYFADALEIDGFTLEYIPELVTELPTLENGGVVLNDDGTMTVNYVIKDGGAKHGLSPLMAPILTCTPALVPTPAGPWKCITVMAPVRFDQAMSQRRAPDTSSYVAVPAPVPPEVPLFMTSPGYSVTIDEPYSTSSHNE